MPRGDRTGPMGAGAMTGRGLGPCAGVERGVYGSGFGAGLGLGCRRGFGNRFAGFGFFGRGYAPEAVSEKTRKELLKDQRIFLKNQMDAIDKQLEEE